MTAFGGPRRHLLLGALVAALAIGGGTADATPEITIDGIGGLSSDATAMVGYEFTVNTAFSLTALGVYDDQHDGLDLSHQVGLWDAADSSLVRSATVASGTSPVLIDDYRYVAVSPATLLAGYTYVLAAFYDFFEGHPTDVFPQDCCTTTATIDPHIAFNHNIGRFAFVDQFGMPGPDFIPQYAVNFLIDQPLVAEAPEPSTLALFGTALAGLFARTRRRR